MSHFTSNTYQTKREILSFSNKISSKLSKPERKFIADMNYGILASRSCLLTDVVDQLYEPSQKINTFQKIGKLALGKVYSFFNAIYGNLRSTVYISQ